VNVFADGVDLVFHGVSKLDRRGICSTSSANYCGYVTPAQRKKRMRERTRRQKKKAEKARAKAEALKQQARRDKRKRKPAMANNFTWCRAGRMGRGVNCPED